MRPLLDTKDVGLVQDPDDRAGFSSCPGNLPLPTAISSRKASRLLHWISGLGNHGAIWQRSCPAQSDGWRKLVDRGWAHMGSGA